MAQLGEGERGTAGNPGRHSFCSLTLDSSPMGIKPSRKIKHKNKSCLSFIYGGTLGCGLGVHKPSLFGDSVSTLMLMLWSITQTIDAGGPMASSLTHDVSPGLNPVTLSESITHFSQGIYLDSLYIPDSICAPKCYAVIFTDITGSIMGPLFSCVLGVAFDLSILQGQFCLLFLPTLEQLVDLLTTMFFIHPS